MANHTRRILQGLHTLGSISSSQSHLLSSSSSRHASNCTTTIFSRLLHSKDFASPKSQSVFVTSTRLLSKSASKIPPLASEATLLGRQIKSNTPKIPSLGFGIKGLGKTNTNGATFRCFSTKAANSSKLGGGFANFSAVKKPVNALKLAVYKYRQAVGLQVEAFWKQNYMIVAGAVAVVLCIVLWRLMFGIASTFIGLSEGLAKYGFLALAASMVLCSGIYLRSRFTVNPDKVYRMAMTKLNTSPAILEVMGAPLTGTDVRAYVISGAAPKLKDFRIRLGGKRCFLIFPIRGAERRGLVSVEVKKKKGQYDMKLLAIDIPMASGPDQRLFLVGDEEEYKVGGGLIAELRDPIVKAMAAEKEFDTLDLIEEEEDEQREREEAERKRQEEEAERKRREEEAEVLRREEEMAREEEERRKTEAENLKKERADS